MLSQAQIDANRRNAQKSSGPRSDTGKAASSRNAITHGLTAKKHILPGEEDHEFDALLADLISRFRPVGLGEEKLVHLIAADQWRLDRAIPYEAGILIERLNSVDTGDFASIERLENQRQNHESNPDRYPPPPDPPDPAHRLSRAFAFDAGFKNTLGKLNRYQSALQRSIDRSLRQLKIYQEARRASAAAAAEAAKAAAAQPSTPLESVDYKSNPIAPQPPLPTPPQDPVPPSCPDQPRPPAAQNPPSHAMVEPLQEDINK
jgi:hypothetical protein